MAANDIAAAEKQPADKPASDGKALIIAILALTLVSAPAGWFLGAYLGQAVLPAAQTVPVTSEPAASKPPSPISANSHVITLAPIVTDMMPPQGGRIRLEIALVNSGEQAPTADIVAEIANDFIALLRQTTPAQIKGATGFMYLREDLLERARIRSQEQISNILISSLVIEQ